MKSLTVIRTQAYEIGSSYFNRGNRKDENRLNSRLSALSFSNRESEIADTTSDINMRKLMHLCLCDKSDLPREASG